MRRRDQGDTAVGVLSRPRRRDVLVVFGCAAIRGFVALCLRGLGAQELLLAVLWGGAFVPQAWGQAQPLLGVITYMPNLALGLGLSDYVSRSLAQDASCVLPRMGRARWMGQRCLRAWAAAYIYEALSCSLVAAVSCLAPTVGPRVGSPGMGCLWTVALEGTLLGALVLWCNLVAVRTDAMVGFAAVWGLHLGILALAGTGFGTVAEAAWAWAPSCRGLVAWHSSLGWLWGTEGMSGANPWVSVLVLGLAAACAMAVLIRGFGITDVM